MRILQHKFVEYIPEVIEDGIVYVSIKYRSATHNCVCGCGNKVVTPISPKDWQLTFDGKTISLYPSIGNWNFECKSHYWITKGIVRHARTWDDEEIKLNREYDVAQKESNYKTPKKKGGFWKNLKSIFFA